MNLADVFRGAASVIERDGFWNGTENIPPSEWVGKANPPVCAYLAMHRYVAENVYDGQLLEDASDGFARYLGLAWRDSPVGAIGNWNDETPGETVVKELRAAADELDLLP